MESTATGDPYPISELMRDNMRHAVAAGHKLAMRGYRNYFAADPDGGDYAEWMKAVANGWAIHRDPQREGGLHYFHVNRKGCEVIGLHKAAIKRAMKGLE